MLKETYLSIYSCERQILLYAGVFHLRQNWRPLSVRRISAFVSLAAFISFAEQESDVKFLSSDPSRVSNVTKPRTEKKICD